MGACEHPGILAGPMDIETSQVINLYVQASLRRISLLDGEGKGRMSLFYVGCRLFQKRSRTFSALRIQFTFMPRLKETAHNQLRNPS